MYIIRDFEPTDAEYKSVVAVCNAAWPDDLSTVSDWTHGDKQRDKNYLHARQVIEKVEGDERTIVGVGTYFESSWSHQPGKYGIEWNIHPDHWSFELDKQYYDYAVDALKDRDPAPFKYIAYTREDKANRLKFLADMGFKQTMREPISELEVTDYDYSRVPAAEAKVKSHGVEIWRLTELMEHDPQYREKLYELEWLIDLDVPTPDPVTKSPFEQYIKRFDNPRFTSDGWFIAVDQGEYVGMSTIWLNSAVPEKLYVGITGILRSHRRKGIATALKLRTFKFVESIGGKTIETGNEENNPMYELNLALGFKPKPAWCDYEKVL